MCAKKQHNHDEILTILKEKMKELNIAPNDLAKQANVSASTVYDILSGASSPRLVTFQEICRVLGLEMEIYGEGEKSEDRDVFQRLQRLSKAKKDLIKNMLDYLEKHDAL